MFSSMAKQPVKVEVTPKIEVIETPVKVLPPKIETPDIIPVKAPVKVEEANI